MSSEYTNTSGRRSSRGGGRRSSGNRNNRGPRPARQETAPVKPKKKTFWQKIAAFFGGEEAPKPAAPRRSESRSPAENGNDSRRAEKPARPSGFRKPEIVEVTSPRVYVGNLSFDATERDLMELFSGVGTVHNAEVVANKHTQRSKGFAFVEMQSVDEAKRAVDELHDKDYMGRKLVVSGAKAVEERRSDRDRQPEQ
jgi:hypothetical protein